MPKLDNQTILLAFAVVTGMALLLQTIFLLAILVAVRKVAGSIRQETEKLRTALMPVIFDTRDIVASTRDTLAGAQDFLAAAQGLLTRITPKVEAAATELVELTHKLREQGARMQSSVQEIVDRVQSHSNRLDGMVSSFLDGVDRAGGFVTEAVSKPVRQVSGILRSVKAVVETLRG